jgi:hypothetical protein
MAGFGFRHSYFVIVSISAALSAGLLPLHSLAMLRFGKDLSLRLEPIGTCIARERKTVAPFRNKVSAHADLLLSRLGRSDRRRLRGGLCFARGGAFLFTCLTFFGSTGGATCCSLYDL